MTDPNQPKALSNFVSKRATECVAKGTLVRFMVQEKVGLSLQDYFIDVVDRSDGVSLFRKVMVSAKKIILLLARLHDLGIVHGDIHPGNIVFRQPKGSQELYDIETDDIVLTDFGLARFFPDQIGSPVEEMPSRSLSPILMSVNQLAKKRLGRRDDIARVGDTVVQLLLPTIHQEIHEAELAAATGASSLDQKWEARLSGALAVKYFLPFRAEEYTRIVPEEIRQQAQGIQEDFLFATVDSDFPDDEPNYSRLKELLDMLIPIVA